MALWFPPPYSCSYCCGYYSFPPALDTLQLKVHLELADPGPASSCRTAQTGPSCYNGIDRDEWKEMEDTAQRQSLVPAFPWASPPWISLPLQPWELQREHQAEDLSSRESLASHSCVRALAQLYHYSAVWGYACSVIRVGFFWLSLNAFSFQSDIRAQCRSEHSQGFALVEPELWDLTPVTSCGCQHFVAICFFSLGSVAAFSTEHCVHPSVHKAWNSRVCPRKNTLYDKVK